MAGARQLVAQASSHLVLPCTPRGAFGLTADCQPGDVDLLFVPIDGEEVFAHAAVAIEVKVLRLPVAKRHKDTTSSGLSQAQGLVRDGFPFVGLLHIVVPEPSPETHWRPMMMAKVLDDFGNVEVLSESELCDPIVGDSAARQLGRLRKTINGSCIGAHAVSLSVADDGLTIVGESTLGAAKYAEKNPNVDNSLVRQIDLMVRGIRRYGNVRSAGRV